MRAVDLDALVDEVKKEWDGLETKPPLFDFIVNHDKFIVYRVKNLLWLELAARHIHNRIAAAKAILEYSKSKPKQEIEVSKKDAHEKMSRPELIAALWEELQPIVEKDTPIQ